MAKRPPNLHVLARRQRWTVWLVLAVFFLQCLPPFLMAYSLRPGSFEITLILMGIVHLVLWIAILVGTVMLVAVQGTNIGIILLVAILMLIPVVNLVVLLIVSNSVNRTFRKSGVRVGLMGVNKDDLERALNPMLCKGCGYDLTGNISGICSECGRPAPRVRCSHCYEIVEANPGMECPRCFHMIG